MKQPKQYVKIDVNIMNPLLGYLKMQPWQDVNIFLRNFEGLPVEQDEIKIEEPKPKKTDVPKEKKK